MKPNDNIVLIDTKYLSDVNDLTIGKVYKVERIGHIDSSFVTERLFITIKNDIGREQIINGCHVKTLKEYRKQKINKIYDINITM